MNLKLIGIAVMATIVTAQAQNTAPAPRREFEVASVKRNTSGGTGEDFNLNPGGRFGAKNVRLRALIQEAYSVMDFQISGGPRWMDSDRFDIAAKAEGSPAFGAIKPMLRTLLEDRFALKVHRETREESAYFLTVVKSGSKMERAEGTCVLRDPNSAPRQPPPGQRPPNYCGNMHRNSGMLDGQGEAVADATGFTLGKLTGQLSSILGRAVLDRTGLIGIYNFHLQWMPEPDSASAPSTDAAAPSIFTALQEQLGLKLESAKGPVEVLVIDHVESPREN